MGGVSQSSSSTLTTQASVRGGLTRYNGVDRGTFLHLKSRSNKTKTCITVLCVCVCACTAGSDIIRQPERQRDKETTETDRGSWMTARSVLGPHVLSSKHKAIDSLQIDGDSKWLSSAMSVQIGFRRIMGH